MWYFSWILGIGFACLLAIINGVWFEIKSDPVKKQEDDIMLTNLESA